MRHGRAQAQKNGTCTAGAAYARNAICGLSLAARSNPALSVAACLPWPCRRLYRREASFACVSKFEFSNIISQDGRIPCAPAIVAAVPALASCAGRRRQPYGLAGRIVPVREGDDPRSFGSSCRRVPLPEWPAAALPSRRACECAGGSPAVRTADASLNAAGGLWGLSPAVPRSRASCGSACQGAHVCSPRGVVPWSWPLPQGVGRIRAAPGSQRPLRLLPAHRSCAPCDSCPCLSGQAPGPLRRRSPGARRRRRRAALARAGGPACPDRRCGGAVGAGMLG